MLRFPAPRAAAAALALGLLSANALAADYFVDASLITGANDGSSWTDAFQGTDGLQAALAAAGAGDRVFVAQGTYRPSATGSRAASFVLENDLEVYGGFVGGESSPEERPAFGTAPTILTADLMGNDPSITENSYHVVRSSGNQPSAVLDGFTITGGNANAGGGNNDRGGGILCVGNARPTVRNCDFVGNRCSFGGGAGYVNGAPTFIACSFIDNLGGAFGGAFDIAISGAVRFDRCHFEGNRASRAGALEIFSTSGVLVTNSTFVDNVATGGSGGGAFWVGSGGSTRIRGCAIVGNRASSQAGGGVTVAGATVTIANSILWDNEGPGGAQNFVNQVSGGSVNIVSYSIVEGIAGGTGNLAVDPMFVDLAGRDLRLQSGSPAIDAGDNSEVFAAPGSMIELDFDGARRRFDDPAVADTGNGTAPIVDIGAFEVTALIGSPFCGAAGNSTGIGAQIDATGSRIVADDDVTLTATRLPLNSNGFFLTSRISGFVANPGGSTGNLCLGGSIGRFVGPGQIQNSGASGEISLSLALTMHPTPTGLVPVQAGETWRFQAWFRDSVLGFPTSNFTDGVAITFE